MHSSTLSTIAYAASTAMHPPSKNAVRLFSINSGHTSQTSKIVHFIRHAEGTHNLNEEESKLPIHFDAQLTSKGIEQCRQLSRYTKDINLDSILVSPTTRTLQTAQHSFPHLYNEDSSIPFIATEEWRETVNYLCDARGSKTSLVKSFPRVNFDNISHEEDPIWKHYEGKYGCYKTHTKTRESGDKIGLYQRSHNAWRTLMSRSEKNIAIVSHSAFFMHNFICQYAELESIVEYMDDEVKELMSSKRFDNCELRSVVVDLPTDQV